MKKISLASFTPCNKSPFACILPVPDYYYYYISEVIIAIILICLLL